MIAKKGYLVDGKLSYSQLNTWIKSKEDYIKIYFLGEPFISNKYIEWGNNIHKQIENGELEVFKLKESEKYVEREIDVNGNKVTLNGYIDSYEPGKLLDYKTSQKEWTQSKVDNHLQLDFYKKILQEEYLQMAIINIVLNEDKIKYIKNFRKKKDNSKVLDKLIEEFIKWVINYKNETTNN